MELNRVEPDMMEVNWNVDAAMKNGFPHFMLKEIHEQPDALKNTILPRLSKGQPDLADDGIPDSILKDCRRIHVIACGTAMHAGMVARALIEPGIRIPVTVSIASEFRYETPLIDEKTLVIVISQSGETIDTLAAMRLAQSYYAPVLAIVNVKGSTIARESNYVLYTHAGRRSQHQGLLSTISCPVPDLLSYGPCKRRIQPCTGRELYERAVRRYSCHGDDDQPQG